MIRLIEGSGALLLLSIFFAHLIAPAVAGVRRRVRFGRRQRPVSDAVAILLLYAALLIPGLAIWRSYSQAVVHWVQVTAPATVNRLFGEGITGPTEQIIGHTPVPEPMRLAVVHGSMRIAGALERETRRTLADSIAASRYARWLAVAPILAFLLLTGAPIFQRSALRVLPRGHLQWRAEEYFRDVNSALAGYVRAQAVAALIVGVVCVAGFALLGVPSAVALGVTTGVLELVPALGPITAFLVAISQAGDRLLAVILFLTAVRLVQDYVVYPKLIRRGMHLSTPIVILTIWCGAALAQAPGVILAIPVAGLISVSIRHWREYREIEQLVGESFRNAEPAAQGPQRMPPA